MAVLFGNWWNTAWTKRKKLTISATDAISANYVVQFRVTSTAAANIYNDSQTSGNDVRILYWTGFKWVELNRHLVTFSASEVDIRFAIQANIAATSNDDNYYLYYGNANPFTSPSELKSVSTTFTGFNEYIGVPYNASQSPTSAITFEGWVYRENWSSYTTSSRLLSKTQTGGYGIMINDATVGGAGFVGALVFRNGVYGDASAPISTLNAGWNHMAATYDGRYLKFYVNGQLQDTDDAGGSFAITYSVSNSLIIGAEAGSGATPAGAYFEGYIEEVRIWNLVRTQEQINEDKDREIASGSSGLVGYWQLNTGSGTVATDSTGNQNGTLTNGVGWITTDRVPNDLSEVYTFANDFEDNTFMKHSSFDTGWGIQTTTVKEGSYAAQSTSASAQSIYRNNINQTTAAFEGWFRFGQTNQFHYPFFNTSNLGSLYWVVAGSTGTWQYHIGGGYTNFPNSATYAANTWYFVRLVYDSGNNTFRVWTGTDQNSLTERTNSPGLAAKDVTGKFITLIRHLRHLNTASSGTGTTWIDTLRVRPWTANEPTVAAYDEADQTVNSKASIQNTVSKLSEAKGYINPPIDLDTALSKTVRRVKGKFEAKWDGISWTDESDYIISARGNTALSGPLGEASAGEMDIELDSTGGRFDPANTSSPIYTYLRPKIEMRLSVDFEDTGFYTPIFYGMTRSIDPNFKTAVTNIHCFDNTKKIMDKVASTSVLTDKRLDEVLVSLAQEAGLSSSNYNVDIAENAIHGAWFNNQNIWEMMGQLAVAERGRVFFDERGILRFWGRSRLRNKAATPITLSQNNWLLDLDYEVSDTSIKNHITVIAKPRAGAGIQQVWSNGDIEALDPFTDTLVFVPAKASQYAFIELEDPATDWIEPIAYSDYTANTEIDSSGEDLTGSIRVTNFTPYDNAVFLIVSNDSDQGVYLTKFTIRANPIRVYKWIKIEAKDSNSADLYGEKAMEIENDFIDDEINAQGIATEELVRWKNAKNNFKGKILGIPYLRCGDIVNVEVKSGNYEEYMIDNIDWNLDQDGFTQELGFVNPIIIPATQNVSARGNILNPAKTSSAKGFINFIT
jgi:hypothetical protein